MKLKFIILLTLFFQIISPSLAVVNARLTAPAMELELNDYKNYFSDSTDFTLNLKTKSKYKITCQSEIIGVIYGDKENIKMYDVIDEETETNDLFSVYLKIKYETYSYIRLYKYNGEITNIILNANPIFSENETIELGVCKLYPA